MRVCRTDLHVTEGDLPVHRPGVTPGHEVVGTVAGFGAGVSGFAVGDRVGVAWLRRTDGTCAYCLRGAENLCPRSEYTGWDADGGYAEYTTAPAAFAHRLPRAWTTWPWRRCSAPGSSATARCAGPPCHRAAGSVSTASGQRPSLRAGGARRGGHGACADPGRGRAAARAGAGAASARDAYEAPPEPLDSAILFAPAGELVPVALRALDRGGVLAVAGIHLSDTPPLDYEHELFYERELRSVTSNTREDAREFLGLAARYGVRATTHTYPLSRAADALTDLKAGRFDGAAVLVNDLNG